MTEIYEVETMPVDNDDSTEALDLIAKLGLVGQTELMGKTLTIPYVRANTTLQRMIKTLCPQVVEIDKYTHEQIPLRVLQEIDRCKNEGWFSELLICFNEADVDPFLVGVAPTKISNGWDLNSIKNGQYPVYVIARWGDELRGFPELIKIAKEKRIAIRRAEAIIDIAENELKLKTVNEEAEKFFN